MTTLKTRFIISILSIVVIGALALIALIKGDAVTAPVAIPTIGGIAGYYTWGKTKNNDSFITAEKTTK